MIGPDYIGSQASPAVFSERLNASRNRGSERSALPKSSSTPNWLKMMCWASLLCSSPLFDSHVRRVMNSPVFVSFPFLRFFPRIVLASPFQTDW